MTEDVQLEKKEETTQQEETQQENEPIEASAEAVEASEDLDTESKGAKTKRKRIRWTSHTFDENLPPLVPFDLEPVTDIPIRQAVEQKAIKNKRDLNIFKTTEEWAEHPKGTVLVAAKIEPGEPYALWHESPKRILSEEVQTIGDNSNQEILESTEAMD